MKKYLILIACFAMTSFCYAQNFKEHALSSNGSVRYAELGSNEKSYTLTNSSTIFSNLLKTTADDSFVLYKQETDKLGITHHHYQQYYQGIKVEGGYYWLHGTQQTLTHLNGDYQKIASLVTKPTLTESVALDKVLKNLNAQEYAWQNETQEQFLKMIKEDKKASYLPKGELLIIKNYDLEEKTSKINHHLCYAFNITATKPDLHLRVYIDVHTGEIIHKVNTVCNIEGTAATRYNGTKKIQTTRTGNNTFRLYDSLSNVHTRNYLGNEEFIDDDNNWTQAEHNPVNNPTNDDVALDAHWGAAQTLGYFASAHGRNGWDGQGARLNQFVHGLSGGVLGTTKDNAQWDGTMLIYGDGETIFKPLTDLDIVAHEIGHAVSQSMQIGHDMAETGGINEAYSDIWAACVQGNWQIGERIMKNGKSYIRNLADPKNTGAMQPGCTTNLGINWYNGYYEKGMVFSHWFYLLSVGGTGTNDKNNKYKVTGISKEQAAEIAYRMYQYLGQRPQLSDIIWASRIAVNEIHGVCSPQRISVDDALYAVGLLLEPYDYPFIQLVTTPAIVCNPDISYLFSARLVDTNLIPISGASYKWHLDIGGRLLLNGNSGDLITTDTEVNMKFITDFGVMNFDSYWETLTITALNCPNVAPISYRFWVGKPDVIGDTYYNEYLCAGSGNNVYLDPVAGATSYKWVAISPSLYIEPTTTNEAFMYIRGNPKEVTFLVLALNKCSKILRDLGNIPKKPATYTYRLFTIPVLNDMSCFRVIPPEEPISPENITFTGYPNPALNSYTISSSSKQKVPFSYKIYNSMGVNMTENSSEDGADKQLDVSTWADGLYVIHLQSGNISQYLKFVVQKGSVAN